MKILSITPSSVSHLRPREGMPQAVMLVGMAILALAVHMMLGASFGIPGLIWLILLTLTAALINPEASFAILLVFFFLQNAFIALVSPTLRDLEGFRLLLGSSFLNVVLTSLICLPAWFRLRYRFPAENRGLLQWLFLFLTVVAVYSLLGAISVTLSDVLLYTRVYLTGGLFLAIGIAFGFQLTHTYTVSVIRLMALILVAWGIAEFIWSYDLYTLFNVASYLRFKFTASGQQDTISTVMDVINFSDRPYLNLTGDLGLSIDMIRPNGPEMHPITYAYCSVFCSLICFIYRSYFLAFASFIMVVLTGAKGPMIMVMMCYLLYLLYNKIRRPYLLKWALIVVLAVYIVIGLAYGMATHDYHVIGFIGGIKGFLANPIGHGIGVGGNLSMEHQLETMNDYYFWQSFGADYGFESAWGVMIYQMGIATVVFFIFYWRVWKAVWNAALYFANEPRLVIVPIALAWVLVNGIFQEEAFSPAGWGLWFLFSGILIILRERHGGVHAVPGLSNQA